MKNIRILLLLTLAVSIVSCQSGKEKQSQSETEKPEWKTGIQTYSFHKFTLMETLDKTKELGLDYAEAFFFQTLGSGFADTAYLNYDLPQAEKLQLKEAFKKRNVQLYALGVAFYDSDDEWKHFFAFAHDMGIHTVTCEPRLDQLDLVEKLAVEYQIEVAIHNHPDPSVYADPSVLHKALEGRNEIMGVCADIGHWVRTGHDPVETLKKFNGRIKVVHLKDLSNELEDTTWGTGILPVKEVLDELKVQRFTGLVSMEYENFSDSQLSDMVKSLEFYNKHL